MTKRILYLGLDPSEFLLREPEATVTHWPIIQITQRKLADSTVSHAMNQWGNYTHFLITSKSTVTILNAFLFEMGLENEWKKMNILALGQATAKQLAKCGAVKVRVAKVETSEGIIAELQQMNLEREENLKKGHLFWPHSLLSRSLISDYLLEKKIPHTSCIFYDTQTCAKENIPVLEDFDEIVFTSPSTVTAFLEIFGCFPSGVKLTSIGPITGAALENSRKHASC